MAKYIPSPRDWVREQVELYESSGGTKGTTLRDTGLPVIIVTNTGNKTGGIRKTPLMRVKDGANYVLVGSQGGAPTHPVWVHNLRVNPAVEIRDHTVVQAMRVREVEDEAERARLWDVADHHVVMPRNVLPQLAQEVVFLDAAWPQERADVVPVRIVQRHHRPIPTEADDMAVLAQLDEIDQLHRTLADLQCVIHVERVHDHSGVLQPQRVAPNPVRLPPPQVRGARGAPIPSPPEGERVG